ncbi:hypothetical protein F4825DRAFT_401761 [Nemania diffusa]|nr:hypothetical protein F4825DRAFT_401761 [Nemania diffusa]
MDRSPIWLWSLSVYAFASFSWQRSMRRLYTRLQNGLSTPSLWIRLHGGDRNMRREKAGHILGIRNQAMLVIFYWMLWRCYGYLDPSSA